MAKVIPKKSININDTSLFAELVKGNKHKREKVLKEILLEKATEIKTENSKSSTNGDLKDIPVPPPNGIPSAGEVENSNKVVQPPLPPLPVEKAVAVIKVTELPMPPGVILPSGDVQTPSPPKDAPPMTSKKVKLTELPMPPTIAGTEELSDDEEMTAKKIQKARLLRPKIINRRLSRGSDGDLGSQWGERCVDVFEIMAQIGEGSDFIEIKFGDFNSELF